MTFLRHRQVGITRVSPHAGNKRYAIPGGLRGGGQVRLSRLVSLGDSITGFSNTSPNVTAPAGVPLPATSSRARGWANWFQALTGWRVNWVFNAGVDGDQSGVITGGSGTGVLQRLARDVYPHTPDLVVLLIGINDVLPTSGSIAQTTGNLAAIRADAGTNGIEVWFCTLFNRADWNAGQNVAATAKVQGINEWIRANGPFIDLAMVMQVDGMDADSALVADVLQDPVHPSPKGGYLMGKAVVDRLGGLITPPSSTITDAGDPANIVVNPMMTGTGGGGGADPILGDIADTWRATDNGSAPLITASMSKEPRGGLLGDWQVITFDGVYNDGVSFGRARIHLNGLGPATGMGAGERWRAECVIEVTAPSGFRPLVYLDFGVNNDGFKRVLANAAEIAQYEAQPEEDYQITLQTPPYTTVDVPTGTDIRIEVWSRSNVAGQVVKFGQVSIVQDLSDEGP